MFGCMSNTGHARTSTTEEDFCKIQGLPKLQRSVQQGYIGTSISMAAVQSKGMQVVFAHKLTCCRHPSFTSGSFSRPHPVQSMNKLASRSCSNLKALGGGMLRTLAHALCDLYLICSQIFAFPRAMSPTTSDYHLVE